MTIGLVMDGNTERTDRAEWFEFDETTRERTRPMRHDDTNDAAAGRRPRGDGQSEPVSSRAERGFEMGRITR